MDDVAIWPPYTHIVSLKQPKIHTFMLITNRNPKGEAALAVAALKGGKVVGIVVTKEGRGYAEVSPRAGSVARRSSDSPRPYVNYFKVLA